jgi:AraC family transcriptional regulator
MSLQFSSQIIEHATQFQHVEQSSPDRHPPRFPSSIASYDIQSPSGSAVLDRLARALADAGVDPAKLDQRAENSKRLAIVASLFELPVSPVAEPVARRPACALPKWRLKRVVEYVDSHISEQITLAALASVAGMSRMYFASQFRVATGLRPHDYVLHKRIERAQHLLVMTSDPLVEIALSVGFQTQAHFTTIFKRISGNTPLRWRREKQV